MQIVDFALTLAVLWHLRQRCTDQPHSLSFTNSLVPPTGHIVSCRHMGCFKQQIEQVGDLCVRIKKKKKGCATA